MGSDILKFTRSGNYKHEISLDDENIIYSNSNGDEYSYPAKDDIQVQKAFKEIAKLVEGME